MRRTLTILVAAGLFAQQAPSNDRLNAQVFEGLELRGIGPSLTTGRVADFDVDPKNPNIYYVATAAGGVWKSLNRGITWTRYQPGYMDARTVGNSIVFSYAGAAPEPGGYGYRLVPVERLQTSFDDLLLTKSDRQSIFENDRHWFRRMFGGNNGNSGKLLVPPARSDDRNSIGIDRYVSTERGFMAGVQVNLEQQGGFVGARYAYLLGGKYVPDVILQADAIFVGQTYLSSQAMVAYPFDGATTIITIAMGTNRTPVDSAEYPSTNCRYCV